MRFFFLGFLICITCKQYAQTYYVGKNNDTVICEVIKEQPTFIKVKAKINEKSRKIELYPIEISSYKNDSGEVMVSKKIVNYRNSLNSIGLKLKKLYIDQNIFLPAGNVDRVFNYWDGHVYITTNGRVTFYEVIIYGSPSNYGRDIIQKFFLEDSVTGLSFLPYEEMFTGKKKRSEIIRVLQTYLADNSVIMTKLGEENDTGLTENAIKKILREYFGKELIDRRKKLDK